MHRLWHFRLCGRSRSIRLALGELAVGFELADEEPWAWRPTFMALNPAGELPVLEMDNGLLLSGSYAISEYLAEHVIAERVDNRKVALFPGNLEERSEVRRLVDWFHRKFDREVTRELLHEKVYSRQKPDTDAQTPNADILRAIRSNLRYHMSYLSFLGHQRRWLAGEEMSFADLAAASHLSSLDYLGEVPWADYPVVKAWYTRIKSRRPFRAILADRIPGLPVPAHYADLDF